MSKESFIDITIGRPDPERSMEEAASAYYAFPVSHEPPNEWLELLKSLYSNKPISSCILSDPPSGATTNLKILFESSFGQSNILMLCCPRNDDLQAHYERLKRNVKATNRGYREILEANGKARDYLRRKHDAEVKARKKRIADQINRLKL
jgi:hypothetical protein